MATRAPMIGARVSALVTTPRTVPVERCAFAGDTTARSDVRKTAPALRVTQRVNRVVIIAFGNRGKRRRPGPRRRMGSGSIRRGLGRRWHLRVGRLRFAMPAAELLRVVDLSKRYGSFWGL